MKVLQTWITRNSGLAILHGLVQAGHSVVGADDRRMPFNLHSRYCARYRLYPPTDSYAFIEAIVRLLQEEKSDVLLPVSGSHLVAQYRSDLPPRTAVPVPSYESYALARDKEATSLECQRLGIPVPELLTLPQALARLQQRSETLVVKPRFDVGGAEGVHYVQDSATLTRTVQALESAYGAALIQEYIPGAADCMRTVNVLFDQDSRLVARFTLQKLRQWPTTGGTTALAVSTHDWELVELVEPLFRKWAWFGPAEVEFKIDPRDKLPKVIEVNPRFWSYVGFPIRCGVNFPALACEVAVDRKRPATLPVYPQGVKYINPSALIKATASEWSQRRGQRIALLHRLFRDLRGEKVGGASGLRDIQPLLGKVLVELKAGSRAVPLARPINIGE